MTYSHALKGMVSHQKGEKMDMFLKIMRKDRILLKKYNVISKKAKKNIDNAKDSDVLYLLIGIELPYKITIIKAEVVTMKVFEKLLKYGTDIHSSKTYWTTVW